MNWVWKKPHKEFARGLIMVKGLAALRTQLNKLREDLVRLEGRQHFLNRQLDENIFPATRRRINAEKVPVSRGIAEKEKQIALVTKQIDAKKMEPGVQEKLPFAFGGGVTSASRPTGLGPMHVPRGTVYMQTGGAIGQQQGGGMFLQPGGGGIPAFNASDYLMPAGPTSAQPMPPSSALFGSVYTPQATATSPLSFVPATPAPTASTGAAASTVGEPTVRTDTPGVITVSPNPTNNYGGYTYDSPQPKLEYFLGPGVDPKEGEAAFNQAYGDWLSATKFGGPTAPDQESEPSPSRSDRMEERTEREMRERLYDPAAVLTPDELRLKESNEFLPGYTGFGPDGLGESYVAPPPKDVIPPRPEEVYDHNLGYWTTPTVPTPTVPTPTPPEETYSSHRVVIPPAPPVMEPPPVAPPMPPQVPPPQVAPPMPPPPVNVGPKPRRSDYDSGREYRMDLKDWQASHMQLGGPVEKQGGGMFLQPDTALPAFNAADYLSPAAPVQPVPTNFSPFGAVYTPTVAASTPLAFTAPPATTTTTPEDTTVNQSYAAAPASEPLEFVSPGGITTGNYLGGTAAELAPDTYFAPNIPGAGQGFTSQFSDPDAMQHLDYSDYPKRSDFGSRDEGGHIDFKQAEREWWRNKAGMGQSYADGGGVEGESAGILSLRKQPGFNLRYVTDIVIDPSSTLDKVLLPLLFVPPIAATAQLIKMGYKGASLTKAMAHLTNMQQKLPKWALGSPGPKSRGFDPKTGSPIYTKKDLVEGAPGRILGGPTTGRRSYVQGQVVGETAAMPFSGSREIDEFRTQDFAKGGIVSLSIGI